MPLRSRLFVVLFTLASMGTSCVIRERAVDRPRGCPGGFWVERHRGPYGRWHEGHWRCPGVIERVEIE